MLKTELAYDMRCAFTIVLVFKTLNEFESISDASDCYFSHLKSIQSFSYRNRGFETKETKVRLLHAQAIVDCNQNFVVTFRRQSSSEPNLIIPIVTSDERNDLFHIKSLSCLEISLKVLTKLGL